MTSTLIACILIILLTVAVIWGEYGVPLPQLLVAVAIGVVLGVALMLTILCAVHGTDTVFAVFTGVL